MARMGVESANEAAKWDEKISMRIWGDTMISIYILFYRMVFSRYIYIGISYDNQCSQNCFGFSKFMSYWMLVSALHLLLIFLEALGLSDRVQSSQPTPRHLPILFDLYIPPTWGNGNLADVVHLCKIDHQFSCVSRSNWLLLWNIRTCLI